MEVFPSWDAVICSLCASECEFGRTFDPELPLSCSAKTVGSYLAEIRVVRSIPQAGICSQCFQLISTADRLTSELTVALEKIRSRASEMLLTPGVPKKIAPVILFLQGIFISCLLFLFYITCS